MQYVRIRQPSHDELYPSDVQRGPIHGSRWPLSCSCDECDATSNASYIRRELNKDPDPELLIVMTCTNSWEANRIKAKLTEEELKRVKFHVGIYSPPIWNN